MSFHALHGSEGYAARSDEVVAHSRKRLRGSAHSVGNVPDAWIFSFQGSLSGKALRKQICLASCGENPLTIRWVMLSDFWTFLFSLSPFNGHFSARCQVSHRIYFCCGRQRGGRAEALSSHLSMDIFLPFVRYHAKYIFAFCGSARLRHARFAWSCRAPQHMRTGFSPR